MSRYLSFQHILNSNFPSRQMLIFQFRSARDKNYSSIKRGKLLQLAWLLKFWSRKSHTIYKRSVSTSQSTHNASITKINRLILLEIATVIILQSAYVKICECQKQYNVPHSFTLSKRCGNYD
jgi:hypothetical protein